MKRMGKLLLALVLMLGVAGCSRGNHDADPVGTWTISWDTDCDGIDGTRAYHFYDDGTLLDASGNAATWTVDGDQIAMSFAYGGLWSGTVGGDSTVAGTYVNPDAGRGCWSGTKTSDTP